MIKQDLLSVIRRCHLTERTYAHQESGIYTFIVGQSATKSQIKRALEYMYSVKVVSVRVLNYKPVVKISARGVGKTKAFRKAYVRLAANQTIDLSVSITQEVL